LLTTVIFSILTILDGESKQLIPVGSVLFFFRIFFFWDTISRSCIGSHGYAYNICCLSQVGIRSEHAYARSLAHFSANLGPVAWKIAAQTIRRALPLGVSFGPGWVSYYEAPPCALLSHEGKSGALLASCTTLPIVPGETKVKSNNCEDTPRLRDQGIPKNLISEGRFVSSTMAASSARQLVSNSVVCQVTDNCQSIRDPQSEVILSLCHVAVRLFNFFLFLEETAKSWFELTQNSNHR
jgi:hypothetical protein